MQAMQMSNGLGDPVGLWLGHLMFDAICSIIMATIIIIVFATVANKFHGLGFFVGNQILVFLRERLTLTSSGWYLFFMELRALCSHTASH